MQKLIIRSLGIAIVIFALFHLLLNLYILILPFVVESEELRRVMNILSGTFGPIAIREDRSTVILSIKVAVSALFFISGIGVLKFKEWSRKLLFCLLGARIFYGAAVCVILNIFHPHIIIILLEGLFLFCYLSLSYVKEQFE